MAKTSTTLEPQPSLKPKHKPGSGPRTIIFKGGSSHSVSEAEGRAKADVSPDSMEPEDAFASFSEKIGKAGGMIPPPFDFDLVAGLVNRNNLLPPLIDVMQVNIDGTGEEIVPKDPVEDEPPEMEDEEDDDSDEYPPFGVKKAEFQFETPSESPEAVAAREAQQEIEDQAKEETELAKKAQEEQADQIQEFFDEPWPGESFLTVRRKLRYDVESVGNGYMEAMRNLKGDLVFLKHADALTIRLIRYDKPVDVEKVVMRRGKEETITVPMRERRYIQATGEKLVWFKEFGCSRQLNKRTGKWAKPGQELPFEVRANELLHFICKRDPFTPYGLPRWWSNSPSVVGSRRAEEFNLNFFDSGGIPPLMLVVSGGEIAEETEKALREHFMSSGEMRHTAAIVEAYATEGSVDSPSNVRVTVERFGSERQQDSMFEGYIEKCDGRLQRAFRIPSIFLGMSADFNFATAMASMMVAEAQVFSCERREFDEVINLQIMPDLDGSSEFLYRSKTLALKDAEQQLKALDLVKDSIPGADYVNKVAETVGLELTFDEEAADEQKVRDAEDRELDRMQQESGMMQQQDPSQVPPPKVPKVPTKKAEWADGVDSLVLVTSDHMRLGLSKDVDGSEWKAIVRQVQGLNDLQREHFVYGLTRELLPDANYDPEGAEELVRAAFEVTSAIRKE